MATAILRHPLHSSLWQNLRRRISLQIFPRCARTDCAAGQLVRNRFRTRGSAITWQGSWYCNPECLERALVDALPEMASIPRNQFMVPHRIPLGLLLLSRQQLTPEQLRTALAKQREAGHGRLGEWLQRLEFADEGQITAALARQWSCPVLRSSSQVRVGKIPHIPIPLLKAFQMLPVDFVPATATLHIAFVQGIDYSMLYAIEKMLSCRTQACLMYPSGQRRSFEEIASRPFANDVVFDGITGPAESARIIRSYAVRTGATELRMVRCRDYLWARMQVHGRDSTDLVLRSI